MASKTAPSLALLVKKYKIKNNPCPLINLNPILIATPPPVFLNSRRSLRKMMMKQIMLLTLITLLSCACGQRGPLYLPDPNQQHKQQE